jgi:hypothetical protein
MAPRQESAARDSRVLDRFREVNPHRPCGPLIAEDTRTGQLFVVVDKVSPEALAEWWDRRLRNRRLSGRLLR